MLSRDRTGWVELTTVYCSALTPVSSFEGSLFYVSDVVNVQHLIT